MVRTLGVMTRGGAIRLAQLSAPRKWEALEHVVGTVAPPFNPPRRAANESLRRKTVSHLEGGGIAGLPSDWLPASKTDHLSGCFRLSCAVYLCSLRGVAELRCCVWSLFSLGRWEPQEGCS